MKKHLKYIDGTSDKFWQIEVTNNKFTVTYGKNGTSGVSQIKSFDTNEDCMKAAEKLLAEKIKKGYSEDGEVVLTNKVDAKTGKVSNISAILEEYDAILQQKNSGLLLPFLEKNSKGNLEAIRKHIKKHKRYWMTFVDLTLEPGYKKTKENQWSWGMRGDEKIKEIITLSAIATFDKTDILSFDEVLGYLEQTKNPTVLKILNWAKPNWIEFYILDKFRKNDWINFEYRALRFLEDSGFVNFNPELFGLCLSRFNSWHGKTQPREFVAFLASDETAYKRDIPLLYDYETNIQNSTFNESPNASYREFNTWNLAFSQLIVEDKLDKKTFIENAILIQTKEWNNNLKLFFRKLIEDLNVTRDELLPFQENIFTFFHNSNPTIANYGAELIKKLYDHPKFKTKSYLEWLEGLMMRNDCKAAIKSSLMILEKLSKVNPKINKQIALLIADIYIISDLNIQERATKLLLKIGSEKDTALSEKLASYVSFMQGSIKTSLSKFLSEDDLLIDESSLEQYHYNNEKVKVLVEEVEIPKDWNDILFLIGRFISSDEVIDFETLINVFISQTHLFPSDYTNQLQPYLKQLEKNYFTSIPKNYVKNLLVNKIPNKDFVYKINDKDLIALNTLKLIKPIIQKALQKNSERSKLPLLSFPTHKPYWVEPKILLERIIKYQTSKEPIDKVDLSIAISRMPRENVEDAIPLLSKLDTEMKDLMSYCLGVSDALKINSSSVISKLFQKVAGPNQDSEKLALWAVAARTYYPNNTFEEFEKTTLSDIPFVAAPFAPQIHFKEKWNEWKNYQTKELERSPSWMELTYQLPPEKNVPQNFIYNLDLHPKKEKYTWHSDYVLNSEDNAYYWNSLMPQNNEPLAYLLLAKNCKTADGTNTELKGFLNIINLPGFQFDITSMRVFACCFFQEKKDIRLLASEILINIVEKKNIDITLFSEKVAYLITNKYGVLLRLIDGIIALKDVSPLHNSALFLLLDGIFKQIELKDKLPTNFKKLVENYLDVIAKTNQKPSVESIQFFEKHKENNSLKPLIKQLLIS
jgi:predicted DNA-binding WGR domain protein